MAKSKRPKISLAHRRGVFPADAYSNDWEMTLIQLPGRSTPVDLDELLDRLSERGVIGATKRDIGAELHAGKIPTPAGAWGLLVALPGQTWAYLLPGNRSDSLTTEIAQGAGLRVIHAGYSDFSNATAFSCIEGEEVLARFESCGMSEDSEVVEQYTGGFEEAMEQTLFTGTRFSKDWLKQFKYDGDVLEALAKEFDAFIPYIGAYGHKNVIEISGFDRKEFKPKDYLRIDLIGFGDTRLEPSAADHQLLQALNDGNVDALRAAVADGADLRRLPGHTRSALHLALFPRHDGKSRRDLVAALLELGVEVNQPGQEPPVHAVLDPVIIDELEVIELLDLLVEHGADVNARGLDLLSRTRTPLHKAAQQGWVAVAKFLVSKGADPRATDVLGRTPRQTAQAAEESIRSFGAEEAEAKYAPILAFLAEAEAGGANLDWHADAEQASRRERRRKREMKVALGKIGEGFKALGQLSGENPSPQAVTDAITYAQPDEIHLTPSEADWATESQRAQTAALLASEKFERIGRYAIPEMPKIQIEAYHHTEQHLYAVIYDAAGQSILDLVRFGQDGTRLTVTNNTTQPETHFDTPDRRTIRLPGADPARLFETIRAEPEPPGGIAPAPAGEFVARFEDAYRREIKARKRQLRRGKSKSSADS